MVGKSPDGDSIRFIPHDRRCSLARGRRARRSVRRRLGAAAAGRDRHARDPLRRPRPAARRARARRAAGVVRVQPTCAAAASRSTRDAGAIPAAVLVGAGRLERPPDRAAAAGDDLPADGADVDTRRRARRRTSRSPRRARPTGRSTPRRRGRPRGAAGPGARGPRRRPRRLGASTRAPASSCARRRRSARRRADPAEAVPPLLGLPARRMRGETLPQWLRRGADGRNCPDDEVIVDGEPRA